MPKWNLEDLYQGAVFRVARLFQAARGTFRGLWSFLRREYGIPTSDATFLARAARQGIQAAAAMRKSGLAFDSLRESEIPFLPGLQPGVNPLERLTYRIAVQWRETATAPIQTRVINVRTDAALTNQELDLAVEAELIEHQASKGGSPKFLKDKGASVVNWESLWVAATRPGV